MVAAPAPPRRDPGQSRARLRRTSYRPAELELPRAAVLRAPRHEPRRGLRAALPSADRHALPAWRWPAREHVEKAAAAESKGVLLLSAHLGNWELLSAGACADHVRAVHLCSGPSTSRCSTGLPDRYRRHSGVELIAKQRGLREVARRPPARPAGGHPPRPEQSRVREGVFVPFFGVPASTSKGLAVISAAHRGAGRARLRPPGRWRPASRRVRGSAAASKSDGDVLSYTAAFNRVIESCDPPRAGTVVLDARALAPRGRGWRRRDRAGRCSPSPPRSRCSSRRAVGPSRRRRPARARCLPYLRALEARAVGETRGRTFGRAPPAERVKRRRTKAYPSRYSHMPPTSMTCLDAIKRIRSVTRWANYTEAHADVTAVREAYEQELLARQERAS